MSLIHKNEVQLIYRHTNFLSDLSAQLTSYYNKTDKFKVGSIQVFSMFPYFFTT